MANGRGSAQGLKKKNVRRGKAPSSEIRNADNGGGAADAAVPDHHAAACSDSLVEGKERQNIGASIPSAGSSGKQAQMVFTIGTFDEDDDSYISDQHRGGATHSNAAAEDTAGYSQAQPSRLLSARRSANVARAMLATNDSCTPPDGQAEANELPTSWKGANIAKTSVAHRLQQKRQALFTMGSHSEVSDMDGDGTYKQPPGRPTCPGSGNSDDDACSDDVSDDHISDDSAAASSSGVPDAVAAHNTSPGGHIVPESTGAYRVHDSDRAASRDTQDMANSNELAADVCDSGASAAGPGHAYSHTRSSGSHNSGGLHECKAITGLSQLGQASPSASPPTDTPASDAISDQSLSAACMPDRVSSAPAIQPLVDNCGGSGQVSFAAYECRDVADVLLQAKGKAPFLRESHAKSRKRPASKKAHLKKAVSTAAIRARSRLGGPPRRDQLLSKTSAQSNTVAGHNGSADCSYVDYSGNSDSAEDDCQTGPHEQSNSSHSRIVAQATPGNVAGTVPNRASPHSSTATLSGAGQDIDDSASTASIDSPRPELSEITDLSQHQQNVTASLHATGNTLMSARPHSPSDEHSGGPNNPRSSPLSSRNETFRDRPTAGLAATYPLNSEPPVANAPSMAIHATGTTAGDTIATLQTQNGQAVHLAQRAQSGPPEPASHSGDPQQHAHYQVPGKTFNQSQQSGGGFRVQGESPTSASRGVGSSGPSAAQSTHVAMSTKRNMESQRQQSMVEKEEEDLDIANALLTGVPRRQNRPPGMAPYVYLNPNSTAYSQQVRNMERTYGHVRAMALPVLESISRCVALREQRQVLAAPRAQARTWAARRVPSEPVEADHQAEWWEPLMPPPPSLPSREQRAAPHASARLRPAELPPWILVPDSAKCAVYGPEMRSVPGNGDHLSSDPSCAHVCELRSRATELKYARQHAVSASRSHSLTLPRQPVQPSTAATTAALETWRGRRVPGLLSVDVYAGSAVPLDLGARQNQRPSADQRSLSSPENMLSSRSNQLASPYRRFGTVYGYPSANAATACLGQGSGLLTAAPGGEVRSLGSLVLPMRGLDGAPAAHPSTAGIWDSDPRRTSYFDRLSIDDTRPQLATSAAQTTSVSLLRRVISGLTGGATAFGTSQ